LAVDARSEAALKGATRSFGPWLWGPRVDLALFAGSAVLALGLVAVGHATGLSEGALPDWGWLLFIVAVDVAHVHATWFRTYLDGAELRAHPVRYTLAPLGAYVAGVALYHWGPLVFWRVLAYLALFHFVRQQAGWAGVYRARARQGGLDKWIDDVALYSATLYPVLHWHAHLASTRFAWFVQGDFVDLGSLAQTALPVARGIWLLALVVFAVRQLHIWRAQRVILVGKLVVVTTTVAIWYIGIVATNSDFDFSVTNVIVHGVPYFGLLWAYAVERKRTAPNLIGSQVVAGGVLAFLGALFLLAFVEELLWDRLVWRDRSWLFGGGGLELGEAAVAWLVPLLALPQATHYVLDGMLWRRKDTRRLPAQRAALGFADGPQG
jgi:hypothetical protein